jgi:hypothetical protein
LASPKLKEQLITSTWILKWMAKTEVDLTLNYSVRRHQPLSIISWLSVLETSIPI